MVFDKLFGWGKKKKEDPAITFGRYSDNNKSVAKVNRWTDADNLFKNKEYHQCIEAFFDYLRDEQEQNVVLERNGQEGRFQVFQGSKVVRGEFNNERLVAEITLAKMPQSSVPVMRRLLEMNFNLYYSRYALDGDRLCMRFDSDIQIANPNKLYYGLKELATKADKQDDLLVQEFTALQTMDTDHVLEIPQTEKEVKYQWFQNWIRETLDYIKTLDADKYSGGIAYLLLTLAFRIDYLIAPEGQLQNDLEKLVDIYYRKDEKQTIERNQLMREAYEKLLAKPKEEVFPYLFRSRHTFAIVSPQKYDVVAEAIAAAATNMPFYNENGHQFVANKVMEYPLAFCQYSYSLPKPWSDLFRLFMQVNYSEYFAALGFNTQYFNAAQKEFNIDAVQDAIGRIIADWKPKYPHLSFKLHNLKYDNLVVFNQSFSNEIATLNFEA
ncbi:YbjN domain-containing protein [Pseudoflavitalea sp. G-6-1-2]|uniref:hypothetical protein n=1 Tax=Pseudoflavitalea sp. G-6-1-2 TaxID=2728841 RepID=UPI00146F5710|nr:hypothetical protein [Pseudoflavitalea sp. G-6-1-2]NML19991.1 YbjN domain-containing protein [Pseudoflavitalea sp. G-6-1-2]